MYPLFETVKIEEGLWCNLAAHQGRMEQACRQIWGTIPNLDIKNQILIPEQFKKGLVKCRIPYGPQMGTPIFQKYAKKPVSSLQLVACKGLDYALKFTDRSKLDYLYSYKGDCDDVLISIEGLVTDTSYSNVVFWDGTRWITPELPLLEGTQRQVLLTSNQIHREKIKVNELHKYSKVVLINAMLGFDTAGHFDPTQIKPWLQPVVNFDGFDFQAKKQ